ncbi:MAG: L-threonylcarbamoyladenylate synthase [Actinomycetaceae bacterium]|nr:L-threonylcarbamoyladenylate synthase [Actinomycetaceae bacterium]
MVAIFGPQDADNLVSAVAHGDLVVLPTDTVYGIGANPFSSVAVQRILCAKGRSETMPPPILIGSYGDYSKVATSMSPGMTRLTEAFWPGALTVILPARTTLGWDISTTGGTVAVRQPGLELTRQVLDKTGPLAVTSANLHSMAPAQNVADAAAYFGQKVAAYLDGGPTPGPVPSTIVSQREDAPVILREGVISADSIFEVWQ